MNIYNRKKERIHKINIDKILSSPYQPRSDFDEENLKGLIQSVRKNGILQPLCVRETVKDKYELVYGHRRLAAAKALCMQEVPCIINNISDEDSFVFSLIENIQRENLSFIEEARAINKLIKKHRLTQSEAALRLGMTQPTIANKLRLLKLSERQIERIATFSLTERHARALLRLPDEKQRDDTLSEIIIKNLSVEQTDRLIDTILKPQEQKDKTNNFVVKDVRLFVNSINKAIKVMKGSGINAKSTKEENESYIKYTVTIPKN